MKASDKGASKKRLVRADAENKDVRDSDSWDGESESPNEEGDGAKCNKTDGSDEMSNIL